MQQPVKDSSGKFRRVTFAEDAALEPLIFLESKLRDLAYKNTTIKTGESFFDDSDMPSDYYLVVVYHKKTNTPLLSSRYYFNHEVISSYLAGDKEQLEYSWNTIDLQRFKEKEIFLADRLSGNTGSKLYRKHRNYIFLLFYIQILKWNTGRKFILMARREKQEKLLAKYIRLGLDVHGLTTLRGKEHWILLGDIDHILRQVKTSLAGYLLILFKTHVSRHKHDRLH